MRAPGDTRTREKSIFCLQLQAVLCPLHGLLIRPQGQQTSRHRRPRLLLNHSHFTQVIRRLLFFAVGHVAAQQFADSCSEF